MITAFDRISVAVPDIQRASDEFELMTGNKPAKTGEDFVWFAFQNCMIECVQADQDEATIKGLVFLSDDLEADLQNNADMAPVPTEEDGLHEFDPAKTRKVSVCLTDGHLSAPLRPEAGDFDGAELNSVDHVVLNTVDGDDCVRLFGEDGLGIRLALDQEREQWGGRMIFFRTGSMSLEIIEPLDPAKKEGRSDRFWGIAYRVADIDAAAKRIANGGVEISEVRDGRKPGTRVATVKSHSLGLPTLLIEHSDR